MPAVSTCLIDQNVFFREGLRSLLADTDFYISGSYPDFAAARDIARQKDGAALVMIGVEDEADDMKAMIRAVKSAFPESRIAVLTARTEPGCIVSAFAAGADGYLSRDISPPVLIGSLNMIMVGEKIYPTALLNMFAERDSGDRDTSAPYAGHRLSYRETQVLRFLSAGETNKQIARDLSITEATVKVHIKAVLRKLDLSNRTQAAVWAVNKGMTHHAPSAGLHGINGA